MERCDSNMGQEARREVVRQKYPSEKAKPQPELLDTRVRPRGVGGGPGTPAKEVGPCAAGKGVPDAPELPGGPPSTIPSRHPRPRPGRRPCTSALPPQDLPRALAAWAGSPRPAPLLPAQPSALPRSPLSAAPAPPAAALQTPPPQGAPGPRREPSPGKLGPWARVPRADPTAPRGRESAGRPRGGSAGPCKRGPIAPAARVPEEASRGRGPGGAGAAVGLGAVPAFEGTAAHPLADLPDSGRGAGGGVARGRGPPGPRVRAPGAAGPRSARTLRARPPAVQRGAARLRRSSGAVPAPSGSAPHTCLCPAPGDVAPSDWRARPGGRGRGR